MKTAELIDTAQKTRQLLALAGGILAISAFGPPVAEAQVLPGETVVALLDTNASPTVDMNQQLVRPGKDFTGGDPSAFDHGGMMANVMTRELTTSIDISGVCAGLCSIEADKVLGAHTSVDVLGPAIKYAVDEGAKVISMSIQTMPGDPAPGNGFRQALEYANSKGVVVVAAAGNNGSGDPNSNLMASQNNDLLLVVGATEPYSNTLMPESNFGPWVHAAASGMLRDGQPGMTSTATARASIYALALAKLRPDFSPDQIKSTLLANSDNFGLNVMSGSELNEDKALAAAGYKDPTITKPSVKRLPSKVSIKISGDGPGQVNAGGKSCVTKLKTSCVRQYATPNDRIAKVEAKPRKGSKFLGWSGGICAGKKAICAFEPDQNGKIKAVFSPVPKAAR